MNRLRPVVLALTAVLPLSAHSAEITRLASSLEDEHPFGMFVDVGFENTQTKMLISHELHATPTGGDAGVVAKPELRYTRVDTRLNLDLHIGIWKDVELHYRLPIVFQRNEYYGFAVDQTNTGGSTLAASENNCIGANGQLVDPNCPTTGAGSTAYAFPATSYRSGLDNMHFGLAWAPFNQLKDDTKPTWVVGLDYEAPTAEKNDPTVATTADARGKLGDKTHKYTFYTTFSRRMGVADPYFQVHYTVPFHGPGWYSNCDHPSNANMASPGNCNTSQWTRDQTGIQVPQTLGVIFGTELNAYEEAAKHQKVGLDLRTVVDYIGPGRYYNEMSSIIGKLMSTQDYLRLGGTLGINAYASDYIRLQATATVLYNTPHLLSDEVLVRDPNFNTPADVNPNFDYRADVVSRHFIASEMFTFQLNVTASLSF